MPIRCVCGVVRVLSLGGVREDVLPAGTSTSQRANVVELHVRSHVSMQLVYSRSASPAQANEPVAFHAAGATAPPAQIIRSIPAPRTHGPILPVRIPVGLRFVRLL